MSLVRLLDGRIVLLTVKQGRRTLTGGEVKGMRMGCRVLQIHRGLVLVPEKYRWRHMADTDLRYELCQEPE